MARQSFVDVALRLRGGKRFNAEVAAATKNLERMGIKGAAAMGAFAQKAGRFQAAGRMLSTRLTLPIVAAGAAAVKMSMDYNASFGKIDRMVEINSNQLEAWKKEILGLSRETAVAPKELADAMYFITSAGLRGKTAMEALTASSKGGAAGLGSVEATADAVTSAMNAYGPSVLSAANATDIMFAAVKAGKMSGDEIAPVIGKVAPLADALALSFDQAAASIAAMTRVNGSAAESATQTAAIFTTFLKPTSKMEGALDSMGLSVDRVRNQLENRGLAWTLTNLRAEAERTGVDLAEVFGNKRALNGVLQLTKNARQTNKVFRETANAAGFTDDAFAKLEKTSGFKISDALNELRVSMIEIGAELAPVVLPALTKALQAVGNVFKWLKNQPKGVRIAFGVLVAAAALLGPALLLVAFAMKAVGVAMILVTSPLTLIVLGILAVIAILAVAYAKVGWFRSAINALVNVWVAGFKLAIKVIGSVIKFVTKNWKLILIALTGPVGIATALIIKNWSRIKGAASSVVNFVKGKFTALVGFFKALPSKISSAVSGAFDGIKEAFRSAINFIIRGWNGLDLSLTVLGKKVTIGTPNIPELANGGTVTAPGTAIVGERGPELLSLPQGASVIPLSGQNAQRIEVPVYLNGRQIALAVAGEVANAKARS